MVVVRIKEWHQHEISGALPVGDKQKPLRLFVLLAWQVMPADPRLGLQLLLCIHSDISWLMRAFVLGMGWGQPLGWWTICPLFSAGRETVRWKNRDALPGSYTESPRASPEREGGGGSRRWGGGCSSAPREAEQTVCGAVTAGKTSGAIWDVPLSTPSVMSTNSFQLPVPSPGLQKPGGIRENGWAEHGLQELAPREAQALRDHCEGRGPMDVKI